MYTHYLNTEGSVERTESLSASFFEDKQLIFYVLSDNSVNDAANLSLLQSFLESGGTLVLAADHSNVFAAQTTNSNVLLSNLGADGRFELEALERGCWSLIKDEQHFPVSSPLTENVNLLRYGFMAGFTPGPSTTVLINSLEGNELVAEEALGCGRLIYFTDTNLWRGCVNNENDNFVFLTNIYNEAVDDTPPVLSGVPENTSVQCDAVPDPAIVTAVDERDGDIEVIFTEERISEECKNTYVLQRTWTATDCNGNTASAQQLINVTDDVPPVIDIPDDYIVYANPETSTAIITYDEITATDNCGEATLEFDPPSGSELPLGITYVTATATDLCGNTTEIQFMVTVLEVTEKPLMVSGGGHIKVSSSAGEYAASSDSKTNFGFNVKYYEQSGTYSGDLNLVFRDFAHKSSKTVYQAVGESFSSLEINHLSMTSATATFTGTVNVYNVSDSDYPVLLAADANIEVSATDNGEPGRYDMVGFTITDEGGVLLYSSNWDGSDTNEITLSGGNIKIHKSEDDPSLTSEMADSDNSLITDADALRVFPNPSSGIFNLNLPNGTFSDSPVQVIVTSADGRQILSENISGANQAELNISAVKPGIYLLQVIQGETRIIRRLEKR